MKQVLYLLSAISVLMSCRDKTPAQAPKNNVPVVAGNGREITFPDTAIAAMFRTERLENSGINAQLSAPGKIAATVLSSGSGAAQPIVLFENPDLAGNYTQLIQHQTNISQIQHINIRQRQIELDRIKDLQAHGAATGQDLLNAQTALSMEQSALANEKASIIEHEIKLKAAGFNPEALRKAGAGTAYLICDIPENQAGAVSTGQTCSISFTAFPGEQFSGTVDAIADVVDNVSRMLKVRLLVSNAANKLRAGMFAQAVFGISEGNIPSISKNALVTVQGKSYVFVKKGPCTFERREIQTGQQVGDRIVVLGGLGSDEDIASEGVIQLKGLSFGY